MTAEVGFLLILLYEQLVGACEEFPVNMPDRFARVVLAVLGEFHGKTVHGALVQACDESLHHLFGNEFDVVVLRYFGKVDCISHVLANNMERKSMIFMRALHESCFILLRIAPAGSGIVH